MKSLFLVTMATTLFSGSALADFCGKSDDRFPVIEKSVGRLIKAGETRGCSATLVSKNCVVTMGSCMGDKDYVEFNVPASIGGITQNSEAEDIYTIDKSSLVLSTGGIGSEWAVVRLHPNSITGRSAGSVQGFSKVISKKPAKNDPVKVIQYSYALNDAYPVKYEGIKGNPYEEVMHYSQQAARGVLVKPAIFLIPEILEHNADTYAGAGGAAIINEKTGELIGINTHGGCAAQYTNPIGARFTNSGTSIWGSKKFKKAILACIQSDK